MEEVVVADVDPRVGVRSLQLGRKPGKSRVPNGIRIFYTVLTDRDFPPVYRHSGHFSGIHTRLSTKNIFSVFNDSNVLENNEN